MAAYDIDEGPFTSIRTIIDTHTHTDDLVISVKHWALPMDHSLEVTNGAFFDFGACDDGLK